MAIYVNDGNDSIKTCNPTVWVNNSYVNYRLPVVGGYTTDATGGIKKFYGLEDAIDYIALFVHPIVQNESTGNIDTTWATFNKYGTCTISTDTLKITLPGTASTDIMLSAEVTPYCHFKNYEFDKINHNYANLFTILSTKPNLLTSNMTQSVKFNVNIRHSSSTWSWNAYISGYMGAYDIEAEVPSGSANSKTTTGTWSFNALTGIPAAWSTLELQRSSNKNVTDFNISVQYTSNITINGKLIPYKLIQSTD